MVCPAFLARLVKKPSRMFQRKMLLSSSTQFSYIISSQQDSSVKSCCFSHPGTRLLGLKGFNLWYGAWAPGRHPWGGGDSFVAPTTTKAELYCNQTLMGLMKRLQDGILWQKSARVSGEVITVDPVVWQKFGQSLWKVLISDSWAIGDFLLHQHTESQNGFVWKGP